MGNQSTVSIDAGAFPGATEVTVAVTGQTGILSGSLAEAWIFPVATSDHTVDEHLMERLEVRAHTVVAGTGFSITLRGLNGQIFGHWNVAWCWN
jgi:hypothetical protein